MQLFEIYIISFNHHRKRCESPSYQFTEAQEVWLDAKTGSSYEAEMSFKVDLAPKPLLFSVIPH